ncbi:hypothetical protein ACOBQJ_08935 [Pelotomaculum propionicicum]|uniref:hypothetical protein n=1 Tax=Pelotomaculum propionicicum TaxID=258475 RepID=UPI003B828364
MKQKSAVTILVFFIAAVSAAAAAVGIFSGHGPGTYEYLSIRGQIVTIYGKGLYQHMSAEVAIQGIAQDYVTLFIGVPLLLISLFIAGRGSLRGRFILAGTLGYFLVTYLFYLAMGMYNPLFLAYAFLMGASFFALAITMMSFEINRLPELFFDSTPVKSAGGFLIFNAFSIALLWLSIVVPPLIEGSIYPKGLEHYTTLIVQGMDLGLLLPLAAVTGVLLIRKKPFGYLLGPVYFIFLSLLMTALTAKITAMGLSGYNIIPVIFIIPTFNLLAVVFSILLIINIKPAQTS